MATRLTRGDQVERNRELVLEAARRVFLAKGYAGASLDAIAEEAGFSKGVVYSQFDSKADLFLVLLERRIAERADENDRLAAATAGAAGIAALVNLTERTFVAEPEWALLVLEFRVHAARDPRLNRQYAEAHARTTERLAHVLETVHRRAGLEPQFPTRSMAELILAVGVGITLERAADPDALPMKTASRMLAQAFGIAADATPRRAASRATRTRRRQR